MKDSGDHPLWEPVVLKMVLPELARELREGLLAEGEDQLAAQVDTLRIVETCGCGDDFCQSFYTGPGPTGAWADLGEHRTVASGASTGMVLVDVVDDEIRYVEILNDPRNFLSRLEAALGESRQSPNRRHRH